MQGKGGGIQKWSCLTGSCLQELVGYYPFSLGTRAAPISLLRTITSREAQDRHPSGHAREGYPPPGSQPAAPVSLAAHTTQSLLNLASVWRAWELCPPVSPLLTSQSPMLMFISSYLHLTVNGEKCSFVIAVVQEETA